MLTQKQEIMIDRVIDSLDLDKFEKLFSYLNLTYDNFPGITAENTPTKIQIESVLRDLLYELFEDYEISEGAREFSSAYFHFVYYRDDEGDDHVIVDFIPDETEIIFGKDGSINSNKHYVEAEWG